MSEGRIARARARFGSSAWLVVAALVGGLFLGPASDGLSPPAHNGLQSAAGLIGGLWLDALKMVVIPLVIALLIKGIVGGASVAGEGRLTARPLAWFAVLYVCSALLGRVTDAAPARRISADSG